MINYVYTSGKLSIYFLILLGLFSFKANGRVYYNEKKHWSINLPDNWEPADLPDEPIEVHLRPAFASPHGCKSNPKGSSYYLNIIPGPISQEGEFRDFKQRYLNQRKSAQGQRVEPDSQIFREASRELNGLKIDSIFIKRTTPLGGETGFQFVEKAIVTLKNGNQYVFFIGETLCDRESVPSQNTFSDLNVIEQIISSLSEERRPNYKLGERKEITSPMNKFTVEVGFIKQSFSNKCQIKIVKVKDKQPVYENTDYCDFEKLSDFFKLIEWGPGEELVQLPLEGWLTYPGTSRMHLVSLTPVLKWKSKYWPARRSIWLDSLNLIGDLHSDCQYEVGVFDGKSGGIEIIKKDRDNLGWEIVKETPEGILLAKVPNNCNALSPSEITECELYQKDGVIRKSEGCSE